MANSSEAWRLVLGTGHIDQERLFTAIARLPGEAEFDYRNRQLAREVLDALAARWGAADVRRRLDRVPEGLQLRRAWAETFDKQGFPSLRRRVVETTSPDKVLQMLRLLGSRLRRPTQITVGDSISLILPDLLDRETEDIDCVDELPEAIRTDPRLMDELATRFGLRLAHFASHYLPDDYSRRTRSLGVFGHLEVRLVDPVDVVTGKLFSRRPKDLDDVREVWGKVDHDAVRERMRTSTKGLRQVPNVTERVKENWYVLTGEEEIPS